VIEMGKLYKAYLSGDRIYACSNCHTHLANYVDIVSKVCVCVCVCVYVCLCVFVCVCVIVVGCGCDSLCVSICAGVCFSVSCVCLLICTPHRPFKDAMDVPISSKMCTYVQIACVPVCPLLFFRNVFCFVFVFFFPFPPTHHIHVTFLVFFCLLVCLCSCVCVYVCMREVV